MDKKGDGRVAISWYFWGGTARLWRFCGGVWAEIDKFADRLARRIWHNERDIMVQWWI